MQPRSPQCRRLRLEVLEDRLTLSGPGANNPGILPPNSKAFGATYGEWAARWWQWAYKQPVDTNPLFDETGARIANGQSGKVWYLGGVFNVSGSAVRTGTVPAGKALFFPILNFEADNLAPPIDPPLDEAGLRALAGGIMDTATDLSAEIDGRSVNNLAAYRVQSPVFDVTFPDNNIFQFFGFDVPAGTYSMPDGFVDDGYYLMLHPLSAGRHTIHFHGSVPAFGFTLDITYNLTVVGGNGRTRAGESGKASTPAAADGLHGFKLDTGAVSAAVLLGAAVPGVSLGSIDVTPPRAGALPPVTVGAPGQSPPSVVVVGTTGPKGVPGQANPFVLTLDSGLQRNLFA